MHTWVDELPLDQIKALASQYIQTRTIDASMVPDAWEVLEYGVHRFAIGSIPDGVQMGPGLIPFSPPFGNQAQFSQADRMDAFRTALLVLDQARLPMEGDRQSALISAIPWGPILMVLIEQIGPALVKLLFKRD